MEFNCLALICLERMSRVRECVFNVFSRGNVIFIFRCYGRDRVFFVRSPLLDSYSFMRSEKRCSRMSNNYTSNALAEPVDGVNHCFR